jgi:hypothetical protein
MTRGVDGTGNKTAGQAGQCRHECVLEIILKDTHTCEHHPERFDAWCRIARKEVTRLEEA